MLTKMDDVREETRTQAHSFASRIDANWERLDTKPDSIQGKIDAALNMQLGESQVCLMNWGPVNERLRPDKKWRGLTRKGEGQPRKDNIRPGKNVGQEGYLHKKMG
jgi:hypothetical protein